MRCPEHLHELNNGECPECGDVPRYWALREGESRSDVIRRMKKRFKSPSPVHGWESDYSIVDEWGWFVRPTCPICGGKPSHFDFHHWDYENGIGVRICRDCHSHIHGGMTATRQAELSPTGDWRFFALKKTGYLIRENDVTAERLNIPDRMIPGIKESVDKTTAGLEDFY